MIATFDEKLAAIFKLLYDRSIDYGGHPNPYGLLTGLKLEAPMTATRICAGRTWPVSRSTITGTVSPA